MLSYISFYNNTNYPYISVYDETELLVGELVKDVKSKCCVEDAGSVSIVICDNKDVPFLDLYISLYPNEFYILEITDTYAKLI